VREEFGSPSMISRNLTQQEFRRAEELLHAQLEAVADYADAGVLLFDRVGNAQLVNRRFAQMVGFPREELSALGTWEELSARISQRFRSPSVFRERWRNRLDRANEASWDELQIEQAPGKRIERFGRPIRNDAGDLVGRIEIYREAVQEGLLQGRELQTEKLAGLGQLVSGIAHELNNPLTSITGYAQLLISRPLPPQQAADARRVFQEAERASHIVKNLLLFARERRPEKRSVDLNEIIERTLALRNYELRVENIAVEVELDRDLPLILADPVQIQQVLLNLIINAEQSIQQSSSEGAIKLRDYRSGEMVVLEVSDTGPGVPLDVLGRIFDPFFTTKPAGVGTGLGLSLAQQILRDHGGAISVETSPGKGARFSIEIPVSGEARIPQLLADDSQGVPRFVSRPRHHERVLVVEDEPTVAQLIEDVLGEQGHTVETFLDGREGLRHALNERYDLVICDLKMPHLDGRMFYQELVRHHSPLQNRIVFITGDVLASRSMDFLESSGLPYLAKPFQVEDLTAAVAHALGEVQGAPPAAANREIVRKAGGS
jgi:signal transduction histidine kinase/CheY-like chemotaxis protein